MAAKEEGRSRSRWSRREIIELKGWLHQGRLINHLAAARGFGEGTTGRNAPQVAEAQTYAADHGADLRTIELDVASEASATAAIE